MFDGCESLVSLDLSSFKTNAITINTNSDAMISMFEDCKSLKYLNFGNGFNTKYVQFMSSMFERCESLETLELSSFNIQSLVGMNYMFGGCSSLVSVNLNSFNTQNVQYMIGLFRYCSSLETLDLSSFNTSSIIIKYDVPGLYNMFDGCDNLRYITLGENFFKTTLTIPFGGAPNLGVNEDGSSNGWIEHLSEITPSTTNNVTKTIEIHPNLMGKEWATDYITILNNKGYTITKWEQQPPV